MKFPLKHNKSNYFLISLLTHNNFPISQYASFFNGSRIALDVISGSFKHPELWIVSNKLKSQTKIDDKA